MNGRMSRRVVAAIFPGQGSQKIGMGREFYDTSPAAREQLDRAERALPGLLDLMWTGPEEELRLTANQQPALVAAGVAAYAAYLEAGGEPAALAAGHSLGEYTALVAAGSLALEDAVRLVRARGRYMQEAVPAGTGAMVAVLKLEAGEVERVAREVSGGPAGGGLVVEVANYNAPGQTVLSGSEAGVEAAAARVKELGGRVVPLKVSAPFHCSLMRPAAERLAVDLRQTAFAQPAFPVVCNVTAAPLPDAADAPELLAAQVTSSVRWVESVRRLAADGEAMAASASHRRRPQGDALTRPT
ncbi:MAG TPA: ACP S-malonyltransferase [Trueperaceae bacterium]|nr:ACP S-malonyltransferase [Trueperaceae bacterium]